MWYYCLRPSVPTVSECHTRRLQLISGVITCGLECPHLFSSHIHPCNEAACSPPLAAAHPAPVRAVRQPRGLLFLLWSGFLCGHVSWMRRAEHSAVVHIPRIFQLRSCALRRVRGSSGTLSFLFLNTEMNMRWLSSWAVRTDASHFAVSSRFFPLLSASFADQSVEWSAFSPLGCFHFSMGTAVSKRKNLRSDAISSVAAKVRWVRPGEQGMWSGGLSALKPTEHRGEDSGSRRSDSLQMTAHFPKLV